MQAAFLPNPIESYGAVNDNMVGSTDIIAEDERIRRMQPNRKVILIFVAMAILWPFFASAQDKPADNMPFVLEKIRADKKLFVAANMQLTETEAKAFWPLYDQYQNELFLLRSRTIIMINDYAAAYENMDDATAKKLIDEYMELEGLRLQLRQAYVPQFRGILPDIKVLRYFQIENKINAALTYEFAAKIPLIKNAP